MLTLSIIKAGTGGFIGHSAVHPDMIGLARRALDEARTSELLLDGQVATRGDDLSLIMAHTYGADAQLIHEFAWDVVTRTTGSGEGPPPVRGRSGPAVGRGTRAICAGWDRAVRSWTSRSGLPGDLLPC